MWGTHVAIRAVLPAQIHELGRREGLAFLSRRRALSRKWTSLKYCRLRVVKAFGCHPGNVRWVLRRKKHPRKPGRGLGAVPRASITGPVCTSCVHARPAALRRPPFFSGPRESKEACALRWPQLFFAETIFMLSRLTTFLITWKRTSMTRSFFSIAVCPIGDAPFTFHAK